MGLDVDVQSVSNLMGVCRLVGMGDDLRTRVIRTAPPLFPYPRHVRIRAYEVPVGDRVVVVWQTDAQQPCRADAALCAPSLDEAGLYAAARAGRTPQTQNQRPGAGIGFAVAQSKDGRHTVPAALRESSFAVASIRAKLPHSEAP